MQRRVSGAASVHREKGGGILGNQVKVEHSDYLCNWHRSTANVVQKSCLLSWANLEGPRSPRLYHKHLSSSLKRIAQPTCKEGVQAPLRYTGKRGRGILDSHVKVELSYYRLRRTDLKSGGAPGGKKKCCTFCVIKVKIKSILSY